MKVKKRQWVFVNYETGEITQFMTPQTLNKARKAYETYHDFHSFVEIFENLSAIKTLEEWEATK